MGRPSLSHGVALLCILTSCVLPLACAGGPSATFLRDVAVVSTQNPLVAQYAVASPCAGQAMVEFGPDITYGRNTAWYPVGGNYERTAILVAGMRASTTYHMRSRVHCSETVLTSSDLTFTTGALPSIPFPTSTVTRPNPSLSSVENPGIELVNVTVPGLPAFFTDRDGNPVWYYDVGRGNDAFPFKLLPNGHIILNIVSPTDSTLREIDLAGNTIRQMDIYALQEKLQNAGYDFVPGGFHHELLPLDNGHVIVLVDCGKDFTDLPGYPGTIQVVGDAIVDLDRNWNPVWAWNSFDYLDVNRHLNGLPDWTHSNALMYSPLDGNILISMRHQSWILKLDYEDGAGTGRVLWRVGYQGDFALSQNGVPTDDPSVWFSFQHFPSFVSQSGLQTTLAIWDNGNDRILNTSGEVCVDPNSGQPYPPCYARATVFQTDEIAKVANLLWANPLPYYSVWGGSINQLDNGNIEFDANDPQLPPGPTVTSEVQEVTQTSDPQVIWKMDIPVPMSAYRAYRVPSLYPKITWQY
jgi:arylsulfate sulfotransferase